MRRPLLTYGTVTILAALLTLSFLIITGRLLAWNWTEYLYSPLLGTGLFLILKLGLHRHLSPWWVGVLSLVCVVTLDYLFPRLRAGLSLWEYTLEDLAMLSGLTLLDIFYEEGLEWEVEHLEKHASRRE